MLDKNVFSIFDQIQNLKNLYTMLLSKKIISLISVIFNANNNQNQNNQQYNLLLGRYYVT
ncbi:hypothetical protein K9L05_03985 [Candidatus Babeliales bacterium]|nr:hypothetical protein [Candidatus Babeliales bacterium]MCF7899777.1 hypothetical protein [Candidatus Babeliales bacterium]